MTTNPVVYFEIPTREIDKSIDFYHKIFGFTFTKAEFGGDIMAYFPYDKSKKGISGALVQGEIYKPTTSGVLIYFYTDDIDAILVKANKYGCKTLFPKTSVGEWGFVAEIEDCEGNRIGLHSDS